MALDNNLLSTAIQHHQAGRLEQAHEIYRRALADEPASATVLSLLGAVCINLRRFDEAAGHLSQALRCDPNHQPAHDNLGVLLAKQGRLAEAVESFRRAIELNANGAQTHLNLAAALARLGQHEDAIQSYRAAAQLAPESLRAHVESAQSLRAAGRAVESVPYFRQVARLKPSDPKARFELAAALAAAGQTGEAIAAYEDVLRLKPDSAETCVNLAQLHIDKRAYEDAAAWARRAIHMRPAFAEAHLNLGCALTKLARLDDAKTALAEAIRLKPELSQAHNNLGIVLAEQQKFADAGRQYRRALEVDPASADARYNLGIARLKQGDPLAAIDEFDRALALKPNYAEAHHNRASALLLLGRMDEGLAEYEWRFHSRDFPPFRPRWKPSDARDAQGRTIVLVAEQGLGDTLQFVRYAAPLAARGARVIVECPAALQPLLARTPGVSELVSPADAAPRADGCVPLMSMPFRMQTRLDTIPADVPYIFADPERIGAWREKLAGFKTFNVGIAWQGNPNCPGDRQRSIPLAHFAPLARVPGVRLFSLQKGSGVEQLAAVAESVVDFGDDLDASGGAFLDTAAIISHLDLVITSDTAHAHLAGALAARVWVALQFVPDWRWLLNRDDSPWYPTMRLFRQTAPGDWPAVFSRIAAELARLLP
jgi:tetratricopeptide (TPR) repeat protein